MMLTQKDFISEPLSGHRRILLYISLVIVERTILPRLQLKCILHHLLVQLVENLMRDHIFDNHESIARDGSDGDLEITLEELTVFNFGGARSDGYGC